MATKRTLIERSRLKPWKGGPVRDWTTSPRLFTGRPKDANKRIVEDAVSFCQRYHIPIRALCRHMATSEWAFRQARDSVRPLPPMVEKLLARTIEHIKAGKVWLRRKSRQSWELELVEESWNIRADRIEPPAVYVRHCPQNALYCLGGLLPGSCPRRWKECGFNSTDWEKVEGIHRARAEKA